MPEDRRLAAIMFTDIVGYTALMGSDEDKALKILRKNRDIQRPIIKKYRGKWLKEMGDGILASFNNSSDAVRCAGEIQIAAKKAGIDLRIGIHEGEVVFNGGDVLGDGVNVASRLEELAEKGAIFISGAIYNDIKNKAGIEAEFIEEKILKNVEEPVKVYKVHFEEIVPEPSNEQPIKRNKLLYYIIGGLIVLIVAILIWQFLPTKEISPTISEEVDKSIAVLPFRNDSPDPENEYICNGMVEDILTYLQQIGDLKVKSRTSIELFRNPTKDPQVIAKELNVAFILEGSVRKIGDNIRINAQLIDGKSGDHLWAESYDGKYTDEIFTFQSTTAKKVAASLQAVITPDETKRIDQKPTSEIMAYDLSWRGFDMVDNFEITGDINYITSANELFDKALKIDPNYGWAIYGKGHAFFMQGKIDSAMVYADMEIKLNPNYWGGYLLKGSCYSDLSEADQAIEYNSKAVELAPNWNWTNMMLGSVYCNQKNDFKNGLLYVDKALKVDGRAQYNIYKYVGYIFLNIGNYERALKYFKISIALQPLCNWSSTYDNITGYNWTLTVQGQFKESLNFIDSICVAQDCESQCARLRFYNYTNLLEYDQAEASFNQLLESGEPTNNLDSIYLAYLDNKFGKEHEAIKVLENIKSSYEPKLTDNSPWWYYYNLASVNNMLGNKEEALQYLSKAVEIGLKNGTHDLLVIDPTFESLRDDPDFKAIVQRAQDEKAAIRAQVQEMVDKGEIDL